MGSTNYTKQSGTITGYRRKIISRTSEDLIILQSGDELLLQNGLDSILKEFGFVTQSSNYTAKALLDTLLLQNGEDNLLFQNGQEFFLEKVKVRIPTSYMTNIVSFLNLQFGDGNRVELQDGSGNLALEENLVRGKNYSRISTSPTNYS